MHRLSAGWILRKMHYVLPSLLLISGLFLYWLAAMPVYPSSIPPDSIYLTIGPSPNPNENETIRMPYFMFIVDIAEGTIRISGAIEFFTHSQAHYFDFYLPFVVTRVTGESGSMNLTTNSYPDEIDGKCSLVHVDIQSSQAQHSFDFRIHVANLVATRYLGEERIILTFGNPDMERLESLNGHFEWNSVDISQLTPLAVSIAVDDQHFFSSNTYPPPGVQYLTEQHRIATWLIQFSGPLSNYYRSIDCTTTNPSYLQLRQLLLFASGAVVSLSLTLFVRVYFRETPTTLRYLWLWRVKRKILYSFGRRRQH